MFDKDLMFYEVKKETDTFGRTAHWHFLKDLPEKNKDFVFSFNKRRNIPFYAKLIKNNDIYKAKFNEDGDDSPVYEFTVLKDCIEDLQRRGTDIDKIEGMFVVEEYDGVLNIRLVTEEEYANFLFLENSWTLHLETDTAKLETPEPMYIRDVLNNKAIGVLYMDKIVFDESGKKLTAPMAMFNDDYFKGLCERELRRDRLNVEVHFSFKGPVRNVMECIRAVSIEDVDKYQQRTLRSNLFQPLDNYIQLKK